VPSHRTHRAPNRQRFIAVTSRKPSGARGKLMQMESRKQVGAEAATGDEPKMRGEARVNAGASYPIRASLI
jgi:hypothetical protein